MSGTLAGGAKIRETNLAKDPDYYGKIGAIGGKKGKADGTIKGFALSGLAREAGAKGGRISRRRKVQDEQPE